MGIDDLGCAILLGGHDPCAVGHLAVGQCGAIFNDQHALAANGLRVFHRKGRRAAHDNRAGIHRSYVAQYGVHPGGVGGVNFVDDHYISHT